MLISDLIILADYLDENGFHKEASQLDDMLEKIKSALTPEEVERLRRRDPTVVQKLWRWMTQWAPESTDEDAENAVLGVRG